MANPVLVEVIRGKVVESRHRGAIAVFDADGTPFLTVGDTGRPVYPRSAVKAIQALPLVESGAADAFGFGDAELALACASHSGEAEHVALAASMLERAGLAEDALECGAHWPGNEAAGRRLAREGAVPCALHNNCSGKHAGFLCTCVHGGIDHRFYVRRDHAAQKAVREAMESVTGQPHEEDRCGTDGCSIPTYAVPLDALALGFARMATGIKLGEARAKAARRILAACMARPFFTSGTGRMDMRLMETGGDRVFVKTGAEGVYCGAIPELGLGIALKVDDGAARASQVMIAALLARLFGKNQMLASAFRNMAEPELTNWRGTVVGSIRPTAPLTEVSNA